VIKSTHQNSDLVLSDNVLRIHPGVVLLKKLRAVFAFAEVDFPLSRMEFGVFSDVVDSPLIHCPAVILGVVLRYVFERVKDGVWVRHQRLHFLGCLDERSLGASVFYWYFGTSYSSNLGLMRAIILMLRGFRKLIDVKRDHLVHLSDLSVGLDPRHDLDHLTLSIDIHARSLLNRLLLATINEGRGVTL
jgi:hypothetical protein